MKPANLVKKISPRDTLMCFEVGQSRVIKFSEIKYQNLYQTAKRIMAKTSIRFTITTNGYPDGTFVRREA